LFGRFYLTGLLVVSALGLCGCAAREVVPVAMVQSGDEQLGCDALKQQIADNSAAEQGYEAKDKEVERQNVAKGIGSAIPYAGILIGATTDLSNSEQVKARALADRNEHLAYLAKQKGCAP
jgi:hypothetical protein